MEKLLFGLKRSQNEVCFSCMLLSSVLCYYIVLWLFGLTEILALFGSPIHSHVRTFTLSYQHIKHKRIPFQTLSEAITIESIRKPDSIAFRLLWIVNAYFGMLSKQAGDECVPSNGFGHFN